jgi:DNA polymerase/3'-5' exonuclease PolX
LTKINFQKKKATKAIDNRKISRSMTGTMNSRPRISSTMSLMGVAIKIKNKIKKIIFFFGNKNNHFFI